MTKKSIEENKIVIESIKIGGEIFLMKMKDFFNL